jgi:hypothetical protein
MFLIYTLVIVSFAQKENTVQQGNIVTNMCNSISRFYFISNLQKEINSLEQKFEICKKAKKDTIPNLQKEIDSLEQITNKCLYGIESDAEICANSMGTIMQKYEECKALNIFTDKYYSSQDTNIHIKFRISYGCKESKTISTSYKNNNIKIDSIFNFNYGNWEITEIDELAGTSKIKTSDGGKVEKVYDKQKRLINYIYIIRRNNRIDTLAYEQYFWEKGRLAKTIFKGVTRNFIYGAPCDSVIVTPSDYALKDGIDFNPPPVYNKSFGLIPEENDLEYEKFKRNPYLYYAPIELLERQKARCEEYKKTQKKKSGKR